MRKPEPFSEEEKKFLRNAAKLCMQCGLCTGVCPPARISNSKEYFNSRLFIRKILKGETEWNIDASWRCYLCYECVKLCPHNISIPEIVLRLREHALINGMAEKHYKVLEEPMTNLLNTGAVVPFGRTNLRRLMGLNPTVEIPPDPLRKVKRILRKTGFEETIRKLSSSYREEAE